MSLFAQLEHWVALDRGRHARRGAFLGAALPGAPSATPERGGAAPRSGGGQYQPIGVKPSLAEGTHSSCWDVTVNMSVSNWLNTANVCALVFCGVNVS